MLFIQVIAGFIKVSAHAPYPGPGAGRLVDDTLYQGTHRADVDGRHSGVRQIVQRGRILVHSLNAGRLWLVLRPVWCTLLRMGRCSEQVSAIEMGRRVVWKHAEQVQEGRAYIRR